MDVLTDQALTALAKVKHIPKDSITPDRTLESLQLDSLDRITLLFELEELLGTTIPDDRLRDARTVADVVESLRNLRGSPVPGT
jgi:acyl carrier protein